MPEIFFIVVRELDGHVPPTRPLRCDVHHAAFPLFFREAVDEKDGLTEFHFLRQRKYAAVCAHVPGHRHIAKGLIVGRASVHPYWNRKR